MKSLALLTFAASLAWAQDGKLRIIAFGAHPDDCDIRVGGTAAKWARLGHLVQFVAVTNGDAGHPVQSGGQLAKRRTAEAKEAAKRLGIADYHVMDNHDGELMPTLENRKEIIRLIRRWNADLVLAPRPNDYHPDHRYTGVLVQDAAYMVMVPAVAPDVPPIKRNPVFLYYEDRFQRPNPFRPDIAVDIDDAWEKKLDAYDAHASQFYEFQTSVGADVQVPKDPAERRKWLAKRRTPSISDSIRNALAKWYGPKAVKHYEAFEICEYGAQPDEATIKRLFPMLPANPHGNR
ncbi:MAG: PIG-L family deacetylase [Acidobacteria bacterium]|nr:PIG-L family deacetylase [Acidobacteriota bacterium]MBI3278239.1 PIG-L family deacetylase [Acidobacteriota bacterium]